MRIFPTTRTVERFFARISVMRSERLTYDALGLYPYAESRFAMRSGFVAEPIIGYLVVDTGETDGTGFSTTTDADGVGVGVDVAGAGSV
jgi:hypothetical protein